jgi:hypothetical protein
MLGPDKDERSLKGLVKGFTGSRVRLTIGTFWQQVWSPGFSRVSKECPLEVGQQLREVRRFQEGRMTID